MVTFLVDCCVGVYLSFVCHLSITETLFSVDTQWGLRSFVCFSSILFDFFSYGEEVSNYLHCFYSRIENLFVSYLFVLSLRSYFEKKAFFTNCYFLQSYVCCFCFVPITPSPCKHTFSIVRSCVLRYSNCNTSTFSCTETIDLLIVICCCLRFLGANIFFSKSLVFYTHINTFVSYIEFRDIRKVFIYIKRRFWNRFAWTGHVARGSSPWSTFVFFLIKTHRLRSPHKTDSSGRSELLLKTHRVAI